MAGYRLRIIQKCRNCGAEFRPWNKSRAYTQKYCSLSCTTKATNRRRADGHGYMFGYMKPGNEPTEHPTLMQIAWGAGWFDGEGSIRRQNRGKPGTVGDGVQINLTQKERWICDRFRALFGGSVYEHKSRELYRWYLSGSRARGFLMTIYSFLSPRRQSQALAAWS